MTRGYRSWSQDLINVWTMPATMLKNKVMYRHFIHSVAFRIVAHDVSTWEFFGFRKLFLCYPQNLRVKLRTHIHLLVCVRNVWIRANLLDNKRGRLRNYRRAQVLDTASSAGTYPVKKLNQSKAARILNTDFYVILLSVL
jgi:hypothetical protein